MAEPIVTQAVVRIEAAFNDIPAYASLITDDVRLLIADTCHREQSTRAMREAAEALVAKLDAIHANSKYQSVWATSYLHAGPYTGPTYVAELANLRAALSSFEGAGEELNADGSGPATATDQHSQPERQGEREAIANILHEQSERPRLTPSHPDLDILSRENRRLREAAAAGDAQMAELVEALTDTSNELRELMGTLMLYDGHVTDPKNREGWSDIDGHEAYMRADRVVSKSRQALSNLSPENGAEVEK